MEVEQDRGAMRINRVYRQLAVCPVMYWDGNEDADAYYLKNQRQWVAKYLGENLGGNLDIYKNMACLTLDEDDCYGAVHPRDAMLPELVLLLCGRIREELEKGRLQKREDKCIYLTDERICRSVIFLPETVEEWLEQRVP